MADIRSNGFRHSPVCPQPKVPHNVVQQKCRLRLGAAVQAREYLFLTYCLQIKSNKRYAGNDGYTISEVAARVEKDNGKIDVLVSGRTRAPVGKLGVVGW